MDPANGESSLDGLEGELNRWLSALVSVNATAARELVASSSAPRNLATAYRAFQTDGPSASTGRRALHRALIADGADEETLSAVDALYLRCLVTRPA